MGIRWLGILTLYVCKRRLVGLASGSCRSYCVARKIHQDVHARFAFQLLN